MTDAQAAGDTPGDHPEQRTTADEREARAEETLKRILAGGDLSGEAQALSNGFTDEYTGRFKAWVGRRIGKHSS